MLVSYSYDLMMCIYTYCCCHFVDASYPFMNCPRCSMCCFGMFRPFQTPTASSRPPFFILFQHLASFGTRSTCTQTQCSISTGTATMVQRIRKVGRTTNLLGPRFGRKVANSYMVQSLGETGETPCSPIFCWCWMTWNTWICLGHKQ